jgi:hypothetical protein
VQFEPTPVEPPPPDEVTANRARVVAALRSGDYAQATGALRPHRDGFCCLGVVEDVRGAEWSTIDDDAFAVRDVWLRVDGVTVGSSGMNETALTGPAMRWLGVVESNPNVVVDGTVTSLVDLNDDRGYPFARIADVLEAQRPDWDGSLAFCERAATEAAGGEST